MKGLEIPLDGVNGNVKKDEEPPLVVDPPAEISLYFDGDSLCKSVAENFADYLALDILKRVQVAFEAKSLPFELLHLVTLAQEVKFHLRPSTIIYGMEIGLPSPCHRGDKVQDSFRC